MFIWLIRKCDCLNMYAFGTPVDIDRIKSFKHSYAQYDSIQSGAVQWYHMSFEVFSNKKTPMLPIVGSL